MIIDNGEVNLDEFLVRQPSTASVITGQYTHLIGWLRGFTWKFDADNFYMRTAYDFEMFGVYNNLGGS